MKKIITSTELFPKIQAALGLPDLHSVCGFYMGLHPNEAVQVTVKMYISNDVSEGLVEMFKQYKLVEKGDSNEEHF